MANLYNNTSNNYYTPQEPDEISLFLQQILLRSSSSSSHSLHPTTDHVAPEQHPPEMLGQISAAEPSSGLNSCSTCSFAAVANVSPSSVGNLDNETDDCDYESEEAVETVVVETAAKSALPRCSSKRSRAAEVHNLSEKRRRSRINEKMKALQNLIPNSNKTDKASMLDEAIEYLKQLQLQVQMLTMRNGLSLYPVCLPGMLQHPNPLSQTRPDVYGTDKYLHDNMTKEMNMNQNISADSLLRLSENCVKQEHASDLPSMIHKTSADAESSLLQHHFGAFQLSRSFKVSFLIPFRYAALHVCRANVMKRIVQKKEKVLPCLPLVEDRPRTSSAGVLLGGKATCSSVPVEAETSRLKDDSLESCVAGADILLSNSVFSHRSN